MIAFLDLTILGKHWGPPVSERACHGLVIMHCDTSFASAAFNHSATSPNAKREYRGGLPVANFQLPND